jgi:signal transduction histidine kinase/DNA-binding response OmpR family regulator
MILIVDDRPENLFALKSILELNNFEVDSAQSGEEALYKILKKTYHLVILDVQMPEMDGFEVAEMILSYSKSKDTPIIFLSAISKEKKFITKGYKAGAVDYITKPVDPDILLLKVASVYAMSEKKEELNKMQAVLLQEIEIRKKSQHELVAKNEELQSVMESMPQIAFTINKAGEIEYTNKKWIEFIGNTKIFPNLHSENKNTLHTWKKCFNAGYEFSEEVKLKEVNSEIYKYFLLKIIPVTQDDHIIKWVGTFTDIEQQKSANEILEQKVEERTSELSKKNEELVAFNYELQQVSWVLSHDLKEPVRKILTYANLIKDRYLGNDVNALPYFNRIIDSSERIAALIDDLLDFSRVSGSIKFEPVDLNEVIDNVLSDLEIQVEQEHATIQVEKLPVIQASPNHIRQLFQNLITNALKFSKQNTPPVVKISATPVESLSFESKQNPAGTFCRIELADNGIGFNEKFLDKIFQVFQRLDNNKAEGTGIGLAIVKKIVERHNGIITAHSKENEGATFIIVLPIKD